jgi:hypothetical protein
VSIWESFLSWATAPLTHDDSDPLHYVLVFLLGVTISWIWWRILNNLFGD